MIKRILIIGLLWLSAGIAVAAPNWIYQVGIMPTRNSAMDLGTTTLAWRDFFIDRICLTADSCRTTWPTGGASSFNYNAFTNGVGFSATSTGMIFNSASSTFTDRLNVSGILNASSTILGRGLTLLQNDTIKLGAQTLLFDGTNFVFNDSVQATYFEISDHNSETITGSWGLNINGDSTHPVQVDTTALLVGISASGGTYNTGDLLVNRYVGIGTTTPSTLLSVHGSALISGTTTANGLIATSSVQLKWLPSCNGSSVLDTDSQGNIICGADATGSGITNYNAFTNPSATTFATTTSMSLANSGMIGFMGNATVDTSNYSLLGNTTLTLLNARSGASIGFRIANTDVGNISTNGGFGWGPTYYNIDAGSGKMIIENGLGVGTSSPGTLLSVGADGTGINFVDNGTSTFQRGLRVRSVGGIETASGLTISGGSLVIGSDGFTLNSTRYKILDGEGMAVSASGQLDIQTGSCITASANDISVDTNCVDATTLDSINGASLLRSDASDNYTSGTLTFDSGTVLAIASGATLNGAGVFDFGGATSVEIVNGSSPTVDAIGEIAIDTTSNKLLVGTSTNATYPMVLRGNSPIGARIASTSAPFYTGFSTGKVIGLPPDVDGFTAVSITCSVWGGTSIVVSLADGSGNNSNTGTCGTATSTFNLGSNSVFTALEGAELRTSTVTGAPDFLYFVINRAITRD